MSDAVHAVKHAVNAAKHAVHAVTGVVTKGADLLAGAAAHAFESVHTVLAEVAATARKDAARVASIVRDTASRVVRTVHDAVSRSFGVVRSAVNDAVTWVKKHNQVIGRIGSVLSSVANGLALAGLLIAPIPGLDVLTPVLEGAAVVTSLGALATQGLARAAGDRNITYGDLFNDALGAIPGGGDADDLADGLNTASKMVDDGTSSAARTFSSKDPLVGDVANSIERAYPGHVVDVNVRITREDGTELTDFDIQTRNSVIQVKSGRGTGAGAQVSRTMQGTDLPVIVYGPRLGPHVVREVESRGGLAVKSLQDLIELIRP